MIETILFLALPCAIAGVFVIALSGHALPKPGRDTPSN
jgi:hypothetical protein